MDREITKNEEYETFIGDLKAILIERVFNAHLEKIHCYHEIGVRILEYQGFRRTANEMEALASDIDVSVSELYRAVQFAELEPDLNKFLNKQNKLISWAKIKNQYLPSGRIEECDHKAGKITVCRTCRKII